MISSSLPSSPTPAPTHISSQSSKPQFFFDLPPSPSTSYPTPPISDPDHHESIPRASGSRLPRRPTRTLLRRSTASRYLSPVTYRQPTLSECLSRRASSPEPLTSDFDEPTSRTCTSSVADEGEEDYEGNSSIYSLCRRRLKRSRLDSQPYSDVGGPSSELSGPSSAPPSPGQLSHISDDSVLDPSHGLSKRRIADHTLDLLSPDQAFKPQSHGHTHGCLISLKTCPLNQKIRLWNEDYEQGYEFPFSLAFNHAAKTGKGLGRPLLAVGSAMGTISFYDPATRTPEPDFMPLHSIEASRNGIFALSFSPSDDMLVTGSGEQISELFDVETGNLIGRLHDHAGTVKTAEFSPENENLIVTGSRDGSIKLWDLRVVGVAADVFDTPVYQPIITIKNAHDEKHAGRKRKKGTHVPSVSSVLWARHLDHHLFSAGSVNGVVKLWDLRKKTPYSGKIHPVPVDQSFDTSMYRSDGIAVRRPHGISSLAVSSDGARVYALGTDSTIHTHDALYLSRPPESQLDSFSEPNLIATSLYLKLSLSPDDQLLSCGSSRGEIFVWPTEKNARKQQSVQIYDRAHEKEICGLDFWDQGLGSCGDDGVVRLWSRTE